MGGQITVRSSLGVGSEFTVALPLQEAPFEAVTASHAERRARPRPVAPSAVDAAASGQLILLAEDNETNRDVIREQLRLLGYAADVVEDGAAALALWRSGRYALLLTDCHMPLMDGFALTAAIRAEEPAGQRLPIIAVTANAMAGEAQHCLDSGMDDYLSKPLRLQELAPMLAKWLPLVHAAADASNPPLASLAPGSTLYIEPPLPESLPIWDADMLVHLVGDNPGMHQRLLGKFLTNAVALAKSIRVATVAGEIQQAGLAAHTLKSSARAVGALRLGALCEQIEAAGQANDAIVCQTLVAKLDVTLGQARSRILARDPGL